MRTGKPAVELLFDMKLYDYFAHHPDEEEIFDGAMNSFASIVNRAIVLGYDFSSTRTVIDIGGGNGSLLHEIHRHHPAVHSVLFERPTVIARLEEHPRDSFPFDLHTGDFFEVVPGGTDIYILKEVLHNWTDEQCLTILGNCRKVIPASSRLLICEQVVLPEENQGPFAKGLDLLMGLEQQGKERTQEKFRALLASAHFHLLQVIHTRSPQWIFEAVTA